MRNIVLIYQNVSLQTSARIKAILAMAGHRGQSESNTRARRTPPAGRIRAMPAIPAPISGNARRLELRSESVRRQPAASLASSWWEEWTSEGYHSIRLTFPSCQKPPLTASSCGVDSASARESSVKATSASATSAPVDLLAISAAVGGVGSSTTRVERRWTHLDGSAPSARKIWPQRTHQPASSFLARRCCGARSSIRSTACWWSWRWFRSARAI